MANVFSPNILWMPDDERGLSTVSLPEITRTGLLASLLEDGKPTSQLTVLHAPRGFGKSTLLHQMEVQISERCPPSSVLSSGLYRHSDFWSSLGTGAEERNLAGFTGWARRLTEPKTLLLDNYERVTTPTLDRQLIQVMRSAPNLRLIIAGRRFSGLTGPLAAAMLETRVVTADELRFSPKELAELSAAKLGSGDSLSLQEIGESTAGWPLAMYLFSKQELGNLSLIGIPISACEALYLTLQTPQERRVAAAIALFPGIRLEGLSVGLDLPEEMTADVVSTLIDAGLVLSEGTFATQQYRSVQCVQRFFASQAVEFFSEEETRRLHALYAAARKKTHPLQDLKRHIAEGDYQSAEEQLLESADLFAEHHVQVLRLLRSLNTTVRRAHPLLTGAELSLELTYSVRPSSDLKRLTKDLRAASTDRLTMVDPPFPLLTEALLALSQARLQDLEAAASHARSVFTAAAETSSPGVTYTHETAIALVLAGQSALLIGDYQLATDIFTLLQGASPVDRNPARLAALSGLALVASLLGDVSRTDQLLETLTVPDERLEDGEFLPWPITANASAAAQVADYYRTEPPVAAPGTDTPRYHDHWPFETFLKAQSVRGTEGPYPAFKMLLTTAEEFEAREPIPPALQIRYFTALADFATYSGQLTLAKRVLARMDSAHPYVANSQARRHLFEGEYEEAITALARGSSSDHLTQAKDALLLRAVSLFGKGEHEEAAELLSQHAEQSPVPPGNPVSSFSKVPYAMLADLARYARRTGAVDVTEAVNSLPEPLRGRRKPLLATEQERILRALVHGGTNNEIAARLKRSEDSVKAHLQIIFRELGVETRQQAVLQTMRFGWLKPRASATPILQQMRALRGSFR